MSITYDPSSFGKARITSVISIRFSVSKTCWHSAMQLKRTPFFMRPYSGAAIAEKFVIIFGSTFVTHKRSQFVLILARWPVSNGLDLSVCIAIPFSDTTCPRKATLHRNSEHFDGFNFVLACRIQAKTSRSRISYVKGSTENYDIVQIDKACNVLEPTQYEINQTLEQA